MDYENVILIIFVIFHAFTLEFALCLCGFILFHCDFSS